jgi:hypothetical protein
VCTCHKSVCMSERKRNEEEEEEEEVKKKDLPSLERAN